MIAILTDRADAPGAEDARRAEADRLIAENLTMSERVAAQYRGRRLEDDELTAEAHLALVEAARRYDVAHSPGSFARFAERAIRSRIREALARAPIVHCSDRSGRRGHRPWTPYRVGVEDLGLQARDDGDSEAVELALADCTDDERELVGLMVYGATVAGAARAMGLGLAEGRALLRGARAALESAFRRRGFELPMADAC